MSSARVWSEATLPAALQAKLDIVIDVLTGLAFAHKRGIVHRDIKPANLFVVQSHALANRVRDGAQEWNTDHSAQSSCSSVQYDRLRLER